jgi:hypothetical protein
MAKMSIAVESRPLPRLFSKKLFRISLLQLFWTEILVLAYRIHSVSGSFICKMIFQKIDHERAAMDISGV